MNLKRRILSALLALAIIESAFYGGIVPLARAATTDCTATSTLSQLVTEWQDGQGPGSITPRTVRDIICSVWQEAANLTAASAFSGSEKFALVQGGSALFGTLTQVGAYVDGIANAFTGNNTHAGRESFSGGLSEVPTDVTQGMMPYTVQATDIWLCFNITSTGVANLPASPPNGSSVLMGDCAGNFNNNPLTIKTTDGSTIDGTAGSTGITWNSANEGGGFKYDLARARWKQF